MNDNPAACSAIWLASEIMPASATTVMSVSWWLALKPLMTGSVVAVSALLSSNAATVNGNPAASVSRPRMICGSRRLGRPGARCPDCSGSVSAGRPQNRACEFPRYAEFGTAGNMPSPGLCRVDGRCRHTPWWEAVVVVGCSAYSDGLEEGEQGVGRVVAAGRC
jgi:hypothetical protein